MYRKTETWKTWLVVGIIYYIWALEGLRLMDTVKINLSWSAFLELRDKHPDRVLSDMDAGNFHFTDNAVFLHLPAEALDRVKATT